MPTMGAQISAQKSLLFLSYGGYVRYAKSRFK